MRGADDHAFNRHCAISSAVMVSGPTCTKNASARVVHRDPSLRQSSNDHGQPLTRIGDGRPQACQFDEARHAPCAGGPEVTPTREERCHMTKGRPRSPSTGPSVSAALLS
jgi:hypothetical protein